MTVHQFPRSPAPNPQPARVSAGAEMPAPAECPHDVLYQRQLEATRRAFADACALDGVIGDCAALGLRPTQMRGPVQDESGWHAGLDYAAMRAIEGVDSVEAAALERCR